MLYELRVYHCTPGKTAAVMKRFADHTNALFEKHGIRQSGFFTPIFGGGTNEITYLLAWESVAERDQRWGAFVADPEWHKVRDASEKDGPIIARITNQLLQPAAFSTLK